MDDREASAEAQRLLEEAREGKRLAHRARRQTRSALSKLDELKRACREYNIRLIIDGEVVFAGKALKEQSRNEQNAGTGTLTDNCDC